MRSRVSPCSRPMSASVRPDLLALDDGGLAGGVGRPRRRPQRVHRVADGQDVAPQVQGASGRPDGAELPESGGPGDAALRGADGEPEPPGDRGGVDRFVAGALHGGRVLPGDLGDDRHGARGGDCRDQPARAVPLVAP
jgi:hypothetical protein